jgi:hypothetical protein
MTAPQSSGTEAIRVDIRQDATHPKKVPMRRMETRAGDWSRIGSNARYVDRSIIPVSGQDVINDNDFHLRMFSTKSFD